MEVQLGPAVLIRHSLLYKKFYVFNQLINYGEPKKVQKISYIIFIMNSFIKNLTISPDCFAQWKQLRNQQVKGFIMSISDTLDALVVESVVNNDSTWKQVTDQLPDNDCRYFVYDLELTKQFDFNDVQMTNRQCAFVSWIPAKSSVKKRMLTASAKGLIKETLFKQKFELDWSLGDRGDLDLEERFEDLIKIRKFRDIIKML